MTVKELIEELSQYPEDAEIVREDKIGNVCGNNFYDYTTITSNSVDYDKEDNQVIIFY